MRARLYWLVAAVVMVSAVALYSAFGVCLRTQWREIPVGFSDSKWAVFQATCRGVVSGVPIPQQHIVRVMFNGQQVVLLKGLKGDAFLGFWEGATGLYGLVRLQKNGCARSGHVYLVFHVSRSGATRVCADLSRILGVPSRSVFLMDCRATSSGESACLRVIQGEHLGILSVEFNSCRGRKEMFSRGWNWKRLLRKYGLTADDPVDSDLIGIPRPGNGEVAWD